MAFNKESFEHFWQHLDVLFGRKVDKVDGKGLSTNDYTTAEKNKLSGIDEGANKTTVDSALSSSSTNPVQNKVVNTAITNLNTLVGDTAVSTQISDAISELDMLTVDITDVEQGTATGINADTLGGVVASGYVLETELDTYKNEVSTNIISIENNLTTNYALKSELPNVPLTSVNGKTGDAVLTADDVGAAAVQFHTLSFPASSWTQQSDGSYTQLVAVENLLETNYAHVDIDMSSATADTFSDLQDAWAMVHRAQSVNGGVMLTAFNGAPEIDLTVKLEVIR